MSIVTKIATKKVFDQRGVLRFPGETVQLDTKPKRSPRKVGEKRDDGLADVGKAADVARATVAIAAIAPTGPSPTAPQQLPAGSHQTRGGYVGPEGERLVGEGSEAAVVVEEGGAPAVRKPAQTAAEKKAAAAAEKEAAEQKQEGENLLA